MEFLRGQDFARAASGHRQEILIVGHKVVGVSVAREGEKILIITIAAGRKRGIQANVLSFLFQERGKFAKRSLIHTTG